ncbi:MAG: methyltransferase domain-containing protein [Candidatus Diapherotrites archaeon]
MPVFRKGRISAAKAKLLRKEVVRAGGKRVYRKRKKWPIKDTPFKKIKQQFPLVFCPLGERGTFIDERVRETGRPAIVVDWGCGKGRAAGELAKEYGDKARVYGYSKDSYPEWRDIDGVKFIHSTKEDLLRYLKDGSVDLIYSYIGLEYLFATLDICPPHIEQLLSKLSEGGKIVFTGAGSGPLRISEMDRILRGKAFVSLSDGSVYITKNTLD